MALSEKERYSKYFRRKRSGSCDSCITEASRLGYELYEKAGNRILMQYKNKDFWATITETHDTLRPWELVLYRNKPTDNDPMPKMDFLTRVELEERKRRS